MEWNVWTKHVMDCPQCSRATIVTGNLDKGFLTKLCASGAELYGTYRYRAGVAV